MPSRNKIRSIPHQRTRNDHATETAEDYVEAIAEVLNEKDQCRVRDLAKHFDVSHVTVSRIIGRLQVAGLCETKPYRPITLTEAGQRLAKKSKQRHETVMAFLIAIGVDSNTAAIDSEGIEHHVSPNTLSAMKRFLKGQK